MCDRCEELEAEIALLKSELGLSLSLAQLASVRQLGLSKGQARFVLALYNTGGRLLPYYVLELVLRGDGEPYETNGVQSFASSIRAKLGKDFLETVDGGYRLPIASVSRLLAVLNPAEAA